MFKSAFIILNMIRQKIYTSLIPFFHNTIFIFILLHFHTFIVTCFYTSYVHTSIFSYFILSYFHTSIILSFKCCSKKVVWMSVLHYVGKPNDVDSATHCSTYRAHWPRSHKTTWLRKSNQEIWTLAFKEWWFWCIRSFERSCLIIIIYYLYLYNTKL